MKFSFTELEIVLWFTVNNWGDLISLTAELGTLKTQVRYGLFQKASLGSLTPPLQSLVIFHNNPCCHSSSGPLRGGGERPIFFFLFSEVPWTSLLIKQEPLQLHPFSVPLPLPPHQPQREWFIAPGESPKHLTLFSGPFSLSRFSIDDDVQTLLFE